MRNRLHVGGHARGEREKRALALLHLGFSQEWIDHVAIHQPSLYDNPQAMLDGLRARGFDNPLKLTTSQPFILGLSFDNIDAKIKGLLERGFKDPHKLIRLSPAILSYSFDNIDAKIKGLLERGFKDPHKLIRLSPAILSYSFDNIDAKIKGLLERGFKDPHKLIISLPPVLALSFDNIDGKIKGLLERGFKDPHKLVTSQPFILGLSFSNIDAKIKGLAERGFENPVKLITSAPATLSYSFDNIDRKIRLLFLLHRDRIKALSEITTLPTLLSYKWRRLLFAVRLTNRDGLRTVITLNPKLLSVAKGQTGSNSPQRLVTAVKLVKTVGVDELIDDLVKRQRLDPHLVRALSRI